MDTNESTIQLAELPPLRIHHFMLWTVVAAALLTFLKLAENSESGNYFLQGSSLPYLLVETLAVSAMLLGLSWKIRGLRFFHEPGHTAFIAHSVHVFFLLVWATAWNLMQGESGEFLGNDLSWTYLLLIYGWYAVLGLLVLLQLYFVYQFRKLRRWRNFFVLQTVATGLQFFIQVAVSYLIQVFVAGNNFQSWFYLLQAAIPLALDTAVMIGLALVVRIDIKEQVNHHWTHWLGVIIWASMWVAMVIGLIVSFFFPPEWQTQDLDAAVLRSPQVFREIDFDA